MSSDEIRFCKLYVGRLMTKLGMFRTIGEVGRQGII